MRLSCAPSMHSSYQNIRRLGHINDLGDTNVLTKSRGSKNMQGQKSVLHFVHIVQVTAGLARYTRTLK